MVGTADTEAARSLAPSGHYPRPGAPNLSHQPQPSHAHQTSGPDSWPTLPPQQTERSAGLPAQKQHRPGRQLVTTLIAFLRTFYPICRSMNGYLAHCCCPESSRSSSRSARRQRWIGSFWSVLDCARVRFAAQTGSSASPIAGLPLFQPEFLDSYSTVLTYPFMPATSLQN